MGMLTPEVIRSQIAFKNGRASAFYSFLRNENKVPWTMFYFLHPNVVPSLKIFLLVKRYQRQKNVPPPIATTWTSVRCGCLPQLGIRPDRYHWLMPSEGRQPQRTDVKVIAGVGANFLSMIVR